MLCKVKHEKTGGPILKIEYPIDEASDEFLADLLYKTLDQDEKLRKEYHEMRRHCDWDMFKLRNYFEVGLMNKGESCRDGVISSKDWLCGIFASGSALSSSHVVKMMQFVGRRGYSGKKLWEHAPKPIKEVLDTLDDACDYFSPKTKTDTFAEYVALHNSREKYLKVETVILKTEDEYILTNMLYRYMKGEIPFSSIEKVFQNAPEICPNIVFVLKGFPYFHFQAIECDPKLRYLEDRKTMCYSPHFNNPDRFTVLDKGFLVSNVSDMEKFMQILKEKRCEHVGKIYELTETLHLAVCDY